MPLSALSAEQLRSLVQDTSAFTWSIRAGERGGTNAQWMALTGQDGSDSRDEGWLDAVHPDDRERMRAAWLTAVSHEQNYNTDGRILSVDGIYRWYNMRGVPVRAPSGAIDHWVGLCLEIPGLSRFVTVDKTDAIDPGDGLAIDPSILRAARAMLNWSAGELAEHSGVSLSTIRRLEQDGGTTQPRRSIIARLMETFAVAGIEFIDGTGPIRGVRWGRKAA